MIELWSLFISISLMVLPAILEWSLSLGAGGPPRLDRPVMAYLTRYTWMTG
jgi:hypothetical protein